MSGLRILMVEDAAQDAELAERELKRAKLSVQVRRVDREEDFRRELAAFRPDVILSDFSMPNFNGMAALAIARQTAPAVPFIFVSGTLGEEHAIRALKDGATDYVLKTNLVRLPPAVLRAVQDAGLRAVADQAADEMRRFRLAMDNSGDIILLIDRARMHFVDANATACRLLGYSRTELLSMGPQDILPQSRAELETMYDRLIAAPAAARSMTSHYRCKDGALLPFEAKRCALRSGDAWIIVAISRDIRERLASERALRESEARFRQTFELAASGMAHVDLGGAYLRVNRKLCEMLGYRDDEFVGRPVEALSHPDDEDTTDAGRARLWAGEIASLSFEKRYLRKDGSVMCASLTLALARDNAGAPEYEIRVIEDITEREESRARIQRLTRVYAMLSGINAAIVRMRDRHGLFAEACRIAVEAGEFPLAWIGIVDDARFTIATSCGRGTAHLPRLEDLLNAQGPQAREVTRQAIRDGSPVVVNDIAGERDLLMRDEMLGLGFRALVVLPLLIDGKALGVLTICAEEEDFFDSDEMKLLRELVGDIEFALEHIQKSEQLEYLAYYDSLTGIANRSLFHERLAQYVGSAAGDGAATALVLLDIERFKSINDALGRQAGDALLKQLAQRILRHTDAAHVGRTGADQFAFVMPQFPSVDALMRRHESRLRDIFGPPFDIGGHELRISAKSGIALFPADGADADSLFRNAEAALKKAKSSGERYLFYTQQMTDRVTEKIALENKLRRALENEEFVLHYQPKVDAEDRRVVGLEALIRWRSPELGLVPPAKFIPLLEETGLIMDVGSWALRRAARDHRAWVEAGMNPPRIAVNVSAIQLSRRDFVSIVERAIAEGTTPTAIDLEITESLIMTDIPANIEKLGRLRELGIGIAIDDFGTGYSSLSYLARLPVQVLKIDRSFVNSMLEDSNTATLVQTVISLAHSLGLKVVAEGVENEEQARVLRLLRCDQMQGYLFSKPLPLEEASALLDGGNN